MQIALQLYVLESFVEQVSVDKNIKFILNILFYPRNHPQLIAVGSGDSNPSNGIKVFLFEFNEAQRRWVKIEALNSMVEPVNDLAFAPNVGRSYNVLAVATNDLKVITVKSSKEDINGQPLDNIKYDVRDTF